MRENLTGILDPDKLPVRIKGQPSQWKGFSDQWRRENLGLSASGPPGTSVLPDYRTSEAKRARVEEKRARRAQLKAYAAAQLAAVLPNLTPEQKASMSESQIKYYEQMRNYYYNQI